MSRNISQNMDDNTLDSVISRIRDLKDVLPQSEVIYAVDGSGTQMVNNISSSSKLNGFGKGDNRSDRAYYYKTIQEHRCMLTDPYPSLVSNKLVVTATFPLYDNDNNVLAIICIDITLTNILKMLHPSSVDSTFGTVSRVIYAAFSFALFFVALLLFIKGVTSFLHFGLDLSGIDINQMFKSTILLTLSLAIMDLVKAIFEEEVLGQEKKHGAGDSHQTMVRFLGSIIIALSIESLMLVFKFALTDPSKLLYAVYLIAAVTALIIGLSIYIKATKGDKK
jgi:hypothetical protein